MAGNDHLRIPWQLHGASLSTRPSSQQGYCRLGFAGPHVRAGGAPIVTGGSVVQLMLTDRIQWLYRGIRWRIVGRWRRLYRFSRFGLSTFRSALVVLRSQLALGPTREIFDELDASFAEVLDAAGLNLRANDRFARLRRLRFRQRLFGQLVGVANATEQVVRLTLPVRWNGRLARRISDARIAELSGGRIDAESMLWTVLPILVSGRPIAISASADSPEPSGLTACRTADLLTMDEHELAHVAFRQLRALLVDPLTSDTDRRPHVSVVMSTNRPDLVGEAVWRMQRQRSVDVELLIGCHGFPPEELAELKLEGGAVSSATVLGFDTSTVFGDVLRGLSDRATAPVLAKWDDDDLYGPHHLIDLWLSSVLARAPLVGKAAEFVLLESSGLLVRRRGGSIYRSTHFLAGGALLMSRRGLDLVGGWGSIPRSVDQDVITRFDEAGLPPFRTHGYEFVLVRHDRGHTWDTQEGYFEAAADEIRSTEALSITHVVEAESPRASSTSGPPGELPTVGLCVPNQNQQVSVRLFEWQRSRMSPAPQLTICDDRSDPPLVVSDRDPEVRIVRAPSRSGFGTGRSRQLAFENSDADVVVFADADMYVEPEVIAELSNLYRGGFSGAVHAEISFTGMTAPGLLGLARREDDGLSTALRRRQLPGQQWRERHWAASADYSHPISSSYRATVSAFLAVDRSNYLATGGFRDLPVRGVEDIEFGYRLQASGCPQRVWRSGGIWHLGERTFAARIDAAEEDAKNAYLSAYVPIWARNLQERRSVLDGWGADIVPFVELRADAHLVEVVNEQFGVGAAVEHGSSTSILSAPFACADILSPLHARAAVDAAHKAFRNRRGGEVVVTAGGRRVGSFIALWAVNLWARLTGSSSAFLGCPSGAELVDLTRWVRRELGIIIVAID